MNIESFAQMCNSCEPVAIVLREDDFDQLGAALPRSHGEWNRVAMTYRGRPIVRTRWRLSYIVQDTPDGPLIHAIP
jgi:hypothetical protein